MLASMTTYSLDEVRGVCKRRDTWWTVLLVDPVAVRLTRLLANRTSITPDQITMASLAMGLAAAGCFAVATPYWLALGALAYHVSFIVDCCEGKLARLKGTGTPSGPWLDHLADRVRMLCCALALIGGQYLRTGRMELFAVGFTILLLDMFRSINAFHAARTRQAIRDRLSTVAGLAEPPEPAVYTGPLLPSQDERLRYVEELLYGGPAADPFPTGGDARWADPRPRGGRSPRYKGIRRALDRCERIQVVSAVEFQMALFIGAPIIGMITPTVMVAGGLLLVFELLAIYRLWLSTRDCEDLIEEFVEDAVRFESRSSTTERPLSDAGVR
jgi:phosphatidylglycerophosphate synthase